MGRKCSYIVLGCILFWMLLITGFAACRNYDLLKGENAALLLYLFVGEDAGNDNEIDIVKEEVPADTLDVISDAELAEQARLEEQEYLCNIMKQHEPLLDDAFAQWLLECYPDACDNIVAEMQGGAYESSMWHTQTGKSLFVLRDMEEGILDSEELAKEHLIYEKECANEDYVSLSFAGDISFANDYAPAQNYTREGIDGAFSPDLQKTMREADIFMLNNEFCYSTRGTPVPKGYNFRADPSTVERLAEMGVDIVSIANNHAYDYGGEAFADTIDTLNEAGMPYVGGGMDIEDAKNHIVYFIANGMKFGYIAATQVERDEPVFTQPAGEDTPGVVRCFSPELVVDMVKQAKQKCDFVIVYSHWGTELVTTIQEDQRELAKAFIDAGADVIVGGHPHCLQGVEYYNGVPVFYSMSNFSFSSKRVNSTVLNLQVTIDGIQQAKYIPCMENGGKTIQCDYQDADYVQIIQLLNDVSANARIDEDGIVSPMPE